MKILKINTYFLLLIIFFFSCQNKNMSKIEYYSDGSIKKISSFPIGDSKRIEMTFYENGNLETISHLANGNLEGEQINFYDSGRLASKFQFKNNLLNGVAYWFYKSGSLKASRFYIDGKQNDMGFDYWDYKFVINKALVRFEDGRVYYKLNFDSSGRPTNEEGDSLHSGVENIK